MSKFYCPRGVQGQSRVAQMQMIGVNPSHSLSSSIRIDLVRVSFIKVSIRAFRVPETVFLSFHHFSTTPKIVTVDQASDLFGRAFSPHLIRKKIIVMLHSNHFKDLNQAFEHSNFRENTMALGIVRQKQYLQIFSIFHCKMVSK